MMKLGVIGNGYVGTTVAVGLAYQGHNVVGFDIDKEKIKLLNEGRLSIYEPGLEKLLQEVLEESRIGFTTDFSLTKNLDAIFLALPTPSTSSGEANLDYVFAAIKEIIPYLKSRSVLITKSTVPPGTNRRIYNFIRDSTNKELYVVSNPEFLREGKALEDFLNPDRIVIGYKDQYAKEVMEEIYKPWKENGVPILYTNWETAELIKYASNSFLAMSISFINELSRLAEKVNANIDVVAQGMKLDKRIGLYAFLKSGLGFGGSCFPKDVRAITTLAKNHDLRLSLLEDTLEANDSQVEYFANKIISYYESRGISNPYVALLGLAFKSDTDDLRESRAIELAKILKKNNFTISAYDPKAISNVKKQYPDLIDKFEVPYELFKDKDGVIIATEWKEFKDYDWKRIYGLVKETIVFDGRNLLDNESMKEIGWSYIGIGKG